MNTRTFTHLRTRASRALLIYFVVVLLLCWYPWNGLLVILGAAYARCLQGGNLLQLSHKSIDKIGPTEIAPDARRKGL